MPRFIVSGTSCEHIKTLHVVAASEEAALAEWVDHFGGYEEVIFRPEVLEIVVPLRGMPARPSFNWAWKGDGHIVDIGGYRYPSYY